MALFIAPHLQGHSVPKQLRSINLPPSRHSTVSQFYNFPRTQIAKSIKRKYQNMSLTPTQLGLLSHLSAVALLFSGLLIPPSKLTHIQLALTFLPPIWACHIYSWSVGLGFLGAVQVLWATELILFQNPRETFQVVYRKPGPSILPPKLQGHQNPSGPSSDQESEKEENKAQVWKQPYPANFWERCSWVFKLHISMRYVGWETDGSPNAKKTDDAHSQRRTQTRASWLLRNIILAMFCFLIIDATNAYQRLDPYFPAGTPIDEHFPSPLAGFLSQYGLAFLPPRMVRILVLGVQQYATFALINRILAIVHVILGGLGVLDEWWGRVENWPMLMGNPLVVLDSGLRGFWGKGWHQLFRSVSPLYSPPTSLQLYGSSILMCLALAFRESWKSDYKRTRSTAKIDNSICSEVGSGFPHLWGPPCCEPSVQYRGA